MMNSRPSYQRALLPLLCIMLATVACFCSASPQEACWNTYGDSPLLNECIQHSTNVCGEYTGSDMNVESVMAHRDCVYAAARNLQSQALSSSNGACSAFRLTSPLDGMANGVNTFYWDPYPGATGYAIEVYESGSLRATFSANSSQTNMTIDMSNGAIGQGMAFLIRAQAFVGPTVACSNDYMILRSAPAGGKNTSVPPTGVGTPTPTGPVCGDNICETLELSGELYCAADCAPG